MDLHRFVVERLAAAAGAATAPIYHANMALWQARVDADHIDLSMPSTGDNPGVPVSRIQVCQSSPTEWLWHTTVGLPTDPDVVDLPVRAMRCGAGVAPSEAAAHQAAGVHAGLTVAPYLPTHPEV